MKTTPIRVLCVFSTLDRGGAESMCMSLYRHIDRSLVQFDFVKHTSQKGHFEEEILALGGRIFEAPRYKVYNHISYCNWWKKYLKSHPEHQIIHGHFFGISAVYFKVAQKYKRITIGHSHSTRSTEQDLRSKIKAILNLYGKIKKYSDYAFACSQEAGEWIFGQGNFQILKNAIDTKEFEFNASIAQKMRNKLGYLASDLVIGHVGNFSLVKNHSFLLDVFYKLHKLDEKFKLMLIGDGDLRPEIEEKINTLQLNDAVKLLGVRSDVSQLMMAMDLFVLPSQFEGLPVVAVEAQGSGLPCLTSNTITNEVALTPECKQIPLEKNIWVDKISAMVKAPRKNNSQKIVDAGYDIHTTALWLQNFYLNIAK